MRAHCSGCAQYAGSRVRSEAWQAEGPRPRTKQAQAAGGAAGGAGLPGVQLPEGAVAARGGRNPLHQLPHRLLQHLLGSRLRLGQRLRLGSRVLGAAAAGGCRALQLSQRRRQLSQAAAVGGGGILSGRIGRHRTLRRQRHVAALRLPHIALLLLPLLLLVAGAAPAGLHLPHQRRHHGQVDALPRRERQHLLQRTHRCLPLPAAHRHLQRQERRSGHGRAAGAAGVAGKEGNASALQAEQRRMAPRRAPQPCFRWRAEGRGVGNAAAQAVPLRRRRPTWA